MPDFSVGTCWSGNWTRWWSFDDPSNGLESETLTYYRYHNYWDCDAITAVEAIYRDGINNGDDKLWLDMFEGLICDESDNNGEPCNDYTVRMCCEERISKFFILKKVRRKLIDKLKRDAVLLLKSVVIRC